MIGTLALGFGAHVFDGGFYNDDWANISYVKYEHDFGVVLGHIWEGYAHRPVYVVYSPVVHLVIGNHPALLNLWSLVLAGALGGVFWALLRRYGVPRAWTAAVVALMLLFPFSDSTRFWEASSHMSLSLALAGCGLLVALRAFERSGRRAMLLHLCSLALYVLSLGLFEITAGLIAASGVWYALWRMHTGRPSWPIVGLRWLTDLVTVGLWVGLVVAGAPTAYERLGAADSIDNAQRIADQGWTILTLALVPFGDTRRDATTLVILGSALAAASVWRLGPPRAVPTARVGLLLLIAGVTVAVCGYLPFVSSDPNQYSPLFHGGQNRVNMAASPGYAMVLVGACACASSVLACLRPPLSRVALPAGVALAALVGAGLLVDVRRDADAWARSWTATQRVLETVQALEPRPSKGEQILTFGHPGAEQFGVPLLGGQVDVTHALRLTYDEPTLTGAAVLEGTTVVCTASAVRLEGGASGGFTTDYGNTVMVDVSRGARLAVDDRGDCERGAATFKPGPVFRLQR